MRNVLDGVLLHPLGCEIGTFRHLENLSIHATIGRLLPSASTAQTREASSAQDAQKTAGHLRGSAAVPTKAKNYYQAV